MSELMKTIIPSCARGTQIECTITSIEPPPLVWNIPATCNKSCTATRKSSCEDQNIENISSHCVATQRGNIFN